MLRCPVCRERVGLRPILMPNALAGVVCPHCYASLQPVAWRAGLAAGASIAAGMGASAAVRAATGSKLLALAGLLAVYLPLWAALTAAVVRLKPRPDALQGLHITR
jgi:hypothetical protein